MRDEIVVVRDGCPRLRWELQLRVDDILDLTEHHLADKPLAQFKGSRWYTRGWTLQELLASEKLKYFAQDLSLIGVTVRNTFYETNPDTSECVSSPSFSGAKRLESEVAEASGISIAHLRGFDP